MNARSESGVTSLQVAVYWRHTPIVKALVEAGADVVDPAAWTLAQKNGYTATLQKLAAKPVTDPQKRYESKGFSVLPPAGKKWSVKLGTHGVVFDKDTRTGGRRTAVAFIESKPLEWSGTTRLTKEQFLDAMEASLGGLFKNERYKAVDHRVSRNVVKEAACLKSESTVEDHGVPYAPGEVFIIAAEDNYCLHPDSSQAMLVKVSHSQRYPRSKDPLAIEAELEPFLNSLTFLAVNDPSNEE